MREMTLRTHAVSTPADLAGVRMRVPPARIIGDTLKMMGAEPVTITIDGVYEALKTGAVDAQENPLAIAELFKLYEVVKYVSMTNHIWSGFNMLANASAWKRLPPDMQRIIERSLADHVRLQRTEQNALNARLRTTLMRRGITFNDVDPMLFRRRLAPLYATWKKEFGATCWSLLEAEAGRLA
jgi:TRAP-type C4-dicarboxylate transport system substrate-binding protein